MNIPDATVKAKVTLEKPGHQKHVFTLYLIEGCDGLWLLLRRSKRTAAKASEEGNVIACFPLGGDEAVVFGEFTPACTEENVDQLAEYGLMFAVHVDAETFKKKG